MNINNLTYAGRLVRDPDLKFTPSNVAICEISVATNDRIKDKQTGEWVDAEPTFLDVTIWGNSGEAVSKYFTKGSQIYLEGRITQDRWTDKTTDQKRSKIKMTASRWQFVDSKQDASPGAASPSPDVEQPRYRTADDVPGTHEAVGQDEIPF